MDIVHILLILIFVSLYELYRGRSDASILDMGRKIQKEEISQG